MRHTLSREPGPNQGGIEAEAKGTNLDEMLKIKDHEKWCEPA